MTEYIPNFILNFQFNTMLALMLYWTPLVFCLIYSIHKIHKNIRHDISKRDEGVYYTPKVTIGLLILQILAVVLPIVNLLYAVFTTVPGVLSRFFDILINFLETPIIPQRKK